MCDRRMEGDAPAGVWTVVKYHEVAAGDVREEREGKQSVDRRPNARSGNVSAGGLSLFTILMKQCLTLALVFPVH